MSTLKLYKSCILAIYKNANTSNCVAISTQYTICIKIDKKEKKEFNCEMKNVIADKIKEIRKNSGMGQRDFGFALGVSTSAVSSYERGERTPTLENLQKIAEIGGTTVDWLVSRSNTDNFNARASDPRLETAVREMEGEWRRSGEPASDFEMRIVGMLRRLPPQVRQIFMDRITTAYFDQMEQEIKKKDI